MHAENRKEKNARVCRDDKEKEEGSGMIDDKMQTLCDRLSATNCGKDEKKRTHRKTSKVGDQKYIEEDVFRITKKN